MTRRQLGLLLTLAVIWSSGFMLVELGLRDLRPGALIVLRLVSASATLAVVAALTVGARATVALLRRCARPLAVMGLVNTTIPFFLIAWGQQYVDSGVAAILNSSAPLFTALLALGFARSERVTGARLVGFVVGFAGVALVAGAEPSGGPRALLGSLAIVAAAFGYAFSALYTGRRLSHLPSSVLAVGVLGFGALFSIPAGVIERPDELPGWVSVGATLVLGVGATASAFLLFFKLVAEAGASRTILVTYLVPSLAVVQGAVFLDEPLRTSAIAGLVLVLVGVGLGTGMVRAMRRSTAETLGEVTHP